MPFTNQQIFEFLDKAGKATYAAGAPEVTDPEKPGFHELEYSDGDYSYRDSYIGHYRSRGMELIRYKNKPIWSSLYGGGMVDGKYELANQTFDFLKKALSADEEGFASIRGPHLFKEGEWKYTYNQDGELDEFSASEEIFYKGELVFFHRIIGGKIDD